MLNSQAMCLLPLVNNPQQVYPFRPAPMLEVEQADNLVKLCPEHGKVSVPPDPISGDLVAGGFFWGGGHTDTFQISICLSSLAKRRSKSSTRQ